MRIKKIKIGIKDLKSILHDVVETGEAIEQGKRLKPVKKPKIYFTSLEALRKALTPKRLELLHIIKTRKPSSINELARFAKRDIKNVADDLKYLGQIGLIEREETDRKTKPVIHYDRIALEIVV
jgi:predicted transcriptional regulator